ncbi:MAG: zinc ribbon domain-containing protein [Anaerolineae bacterium]|nr:zinc ribbon domain-containing protein [Anaerolineae bacterium]
MNLSRCPACGASVPPETTQCPYCHSYFTQGGAASPAQSTTEFKGFTFERRAEPNEQAFTLAVPKGWLMVGGVVRANHMQQTVNAQTIAAKVDFAVKRDTEGSVMIRWAPEVKYCDMRGMPAAMFFPQGSQYNGMVVWPLMSGAEFLVRMVFPWAHPQAQGGQMIRQQAQPLMVEHFKREAAKLGGTTPFQYDGGEAVFQYTENGIRFEEHAFTCIEYMGPVAGGMWSNKNTVLLRAPAGEYERWEPVLKHIWTSGELNLQWMASEQASQEMLTHAFMNAQQAEQARARRALEIQRDLQRISQEIVEHQRLTHAEIRNDGYLLLTGQEEYVNPITKQVDTGSNEWRHRWVTANNEEFYTDDTSFNPNNDDRLNQVKWEYTPVRPRFPQ